MTPFTPHTDQHVRSVKVAIITPPPVGERSIVMTISACLSVCSHAYLWNYTLDLRQFFVRVFCGCGSVFHWRR